MKKIKIGFIGQGWIGKNYADNFEERGYSIVRYDISNQYKGNKEQLKSCDIIFVAVPTPSTLNGFDDSILIDAIKNNAKDGQTIVIKSTIQLGTTKKLQKMFPYLYIMHSPEFLTEKTAKYDAANPARNIIGYTEKSFCKTTMVMNVLPVAPYEDIVKAEEAELVKYMGNCWFYFKVMAMNLFYDIAKDKNLDFEKLKEMLAADKRVGRTHLDVEHQGGRGAGGHCFIKDFAALREMYGNIEHSNVNGMHLIRTAENYNRELLESTGKDLDLLNGVYGNIKIKNKNHLLKGKHKPYFIQEQEEMIKFEKEGKISYFDYKDGKWQFWGDLEIDESAKTLFDVLGDIITEHIKKNNIKECVHDWVYSNTMLLSNPPQQDKICKKCGLTERDTMGELLEDEYSKTVKKFNK